MAKNKKYPLIELRQRKGAKGIMTGGNTELLIDGKPLKGATKATFEVAANGVAKMTVEVLGQMAITGRIGSFSKVVSKINTE